MTAKRLAGVVIAVLMVGLGALWTARGFGWLGGSQMSGQPIWAVIGPLVMGLGVSLAIVVVQRIRQPQRDDGLNGRYGR